MDYAKKTSWLFRPSAAQLQYDTDVFLVYTTVYVHPNQSKNHLMNPRNPFYRFLARLSTLWHDRIFTDSCNVFAPHYRQVGMESLTMSDEEFDRNSAVAYSDVRDAFFYYMEHCNQGRPFILAGHSQGSAMLLDLLRREFGKRDFGRQFVAAYLIGYSVTRDDFILYPHLKIAKSEDDLGSIISYNTSAEGLRLMRVVRKGAICVNPLNWKLTEEYAPRELNLGSVLFDCGKYFRLEKKHFTGAYIDKKQGVLMIDKDALNELLHIRIGFLNKILLHRQSLHTLDIALFHRNLQKNIRTRIEAFHKKRTFP